MNHIIGRDVEVIIDGRAELEVDVVVAGGGSMTGIVSRVIVGAICDMAAKWVVEQACIRQRELNGLSPRSRAGKAARWK